MSQLPNGTKVKCTAHQGAHTGTVVHDLGFAYGVHWDPTKVDGELAKTHRSDFIYTEYDKVVAS